MDRKKILAFLLIAFLISATACCYHLFKPQGSVNTSAYTGADSGTDTGTDIGDDSGADFGTDTGTDTGADTGIYAGADMEGKLVVTNLCVGKADSAILLYNKIAGIIDAGTDNSFAKIDGWLQSRGIHTLDFMILTHYDQDHIGSAAKLLNRYDAEKIYLPDYGSTKKYYDDLMAAVSGRKNVFFISETASVRFEDLNIEIIPADDPGTLLADEDNRDNNLSLLCMARFGERRLFFTGDIEKDRIEQMLDSGTDYNADWIKMPHHGDYQKNVKKLLDAVNPAYSVISTSPDQPPEEKLLQLLDERGIKYFDTMASDVVTICDGSEITVADE